MTPASHSDLSPVIGYLRAILTDVSEVARFCELSPGEEWAVYIASHIVTDHDAGLPVSPRDIGDAFHNFVWRGMMDKAAREKTREPQPFEKYPGLADSIRHLAGNMTGVSLARWNDHLAHINIYLRTHEIDNARLQARIGELEGENEELLQVDRDVHAELDKIGLSKGSGGDDGEYNVFGRIADLLIPQLTLLRARVSELEAARFQPAIELLQSFYDGLSPSFVRGAILLCIRQLERGRLLTPKEKFENLKNALTEQDVAQ